MIRHWFEPHARKLRRQRADYERGYRYASGELLQSKGAAQERLDYEIDTAWSTDTYGDFDRGISNALRDWRWLHAPDWKLLP